MNDKRRQARLQGRHDAHLSKTRPVFEKEEILHDQSRCQNEVTDSKVVSPFVVQPADASCNSEKTQEVDSQEAQAAANIQERLQDRNKNRGKKHSQRGSFYPSRRGDRKGVTNYESRCISPDGTLQSLNGLNVNIDDAVNSNCISAERHNYPTRFYTPKNGKHMPQRGNNRIQFNADTSEQSYNSKARSKHNLSRGRNANRFARNKPRFDRTYYSTDESAITEANVVRSYDSEDRTEIQRSVSVDNYRLTQESRKDSYNGVNGINDGYQRLNIGKSSRFVYEQTDQAENVIQKNKGPITLKINGWHKMVQRSPEEKESLLYFKPDFLGEERETYYHHLRESINWQEKEIIIRGEKYMQPRLVAWYGPLPYTYSNSVLEPNCEFPPVILDLKERIEIILREDQKNVTFNSVLLNLYRDGKDSVAWHSDDELSMGIHPTIGSVSLGETRRFEMKQKQDCRADGAYQHESEEYVIHLTSGSLLVMDGAMQQYWLHRVPKEYHDRNCRINLTFRTVFPMKEK